MLVTDGTDKQGSSPRMRGTPLSYHSDSRGHGIIPAYAGNTDCPTWSLKRFGDHPRVCGEHIDPAHPEIDQTGIIPAYAGNTNFDAPRDFLDRDHPRVCGEHISIERLYCPSRGSSPRMRGTRHNRASRQRSQGIIPAYAGNTFDDCMHIREKRDHPRVCGEHVGRASGLWDGWGSSPRMRGTPTPHAADRCSSGIIPAYAGNTRRPIM